MLMKAARTAIRRSRSWEGCFWMTRVSFGLTSNGPRYCLVTELRNRVHMREFAPNGHFKDISHAVRRGLFGELVKQLTPTGFSALPRPSPQIQYRQVFRGLSNLSMYGACFVQLVMMNGTGSSGIGYHRAIPYVLDDGNSYKDHIMQAHSLLSAAAVNNMGQSSFVATLQFVFCKPRT
jgi:hypothetical protein